MTKPKWPSLAYWLAYLVTLLPGLLVLGMYAFNREYGTTPESELTRVEGVPTDVKLSSVGSRRGGTKYFLKFRVGEYVTEYSSEQPNFQKVESTIQSGEPVEMWVSTKRETLFSRRETVPLYKLQSEGEPVLAYSDVVANKAREAEMGLSIGIFLTVSALLFAGASIVRTRFAH